MDKLTSVKKPQDAATGLNSCPENMLDEQLASKKDELTFYSNPPTSSGDDTSTIKGNGCFTQSNDRGICHPDGLNKGMQYHNGFLVYYFPGYNPYTFWAPVVLDWRRIGQQQYFSSSGVPQQIIYSESESRPYFSRQTTLGKDVRNGTNYGSRNLNYGRGSFVAGRYNNSLSTERNKNFYCKYKSLPQTQPEKALNKMVHIGSDFADPYLKGDNPAGKVSRFTKQTQDFFSSNGPVNPRRDEGEWNGYDRLKSGDRPRRKEELNAELARGPRSRINSSGSVAKTEALGSRVCREEYNKSDFQTDYENSKFYVIKSYSEDDIHKCIKYDVWSSTPKGNRKLDTAFHEAEAKSIETGKNCPVFLFFSVNGSGQFVGIAEIIGQVDFNKNMDFWQAEKWSGFFPVKWHIIKDVSNSQLRHIILDNNEDRDVTFTRDTHEIGPKQGLEMLNIFKSYVAKTSLLDDFNFYESREISLRKRRSSKPETPREETYGDYNNLIKHGAERFADSASLEDLTNNLSLNDTST